MGPSQNCDFRCVASRAAEKLVSIALSCLPLWWLDTATPENLTDVAKGHHRCHQGWKRTFPMPPRLRGRSSVWPGPGTGAFTTGGRGTGPESKRGEGGRGQTRRQRKMPHGQPRMKGGEEQAAWADAGKGKEQSLPEPPGGTQSCPPLRPDPLLDLTPRTVTNARSKLLNSEVICHSSVNR